MCACMYVWGGMAKLEAVRGSVTDLCHILRWMDMRTAAAGACLGNSGVCFPLVRHYEISSLKGEAPFSER